MRSTLAPLSVAILACLLTACASGGGSEDNSGPGVVVRPDDQPGPSDPVWTRTYRVAQTEAAYKRGFYGRGVIIGIHDNVVKPHPDLLGKDLGRISDGFPTDVMEGDQDHGTAVAMTILGRPFGSYQGGVAPAAQFYWTDRGSLANYQSMIDKGVDILNISLASDKFVGQVDYATQVDFLNNSSTGQSYEALFNAGVLVVVAGGNASNGNVSTLAGTRYYRPDLTNWITVVATNGDGTSLASYSNKCGLAKDFCLAAPGEVRLPAATLTSLNDPFTSYRWLGTSFAAPTVTGVAALVKQAFPWMDGSQLATTLLTTATDIGPVGVDTTFGHGMVNADKATLGPAAITSAFKANVGAEYDSVFGNDISGEGSIVKEGGGSLTLAGQNTYTGGTFVDAGTLRLTGAVAGDLFQQGGVFQGQGTIAGDYRQQGGQLSLVAGETLTVGGVAQIGEVAVAAGTNEYLGAHWSDTVLTAASIEGAPTDAQQSLFYATQVSIAGNTLVADAQRRSGDAALAGIADSSTRMAARGLDAAFAQTDAHGSAAQRALLTSFQGLGTADAGRLDSLAGQAHATTRSIALEAGEMQQRWVDARVSEATFSRNGGTWFMAGALEGDLRPADAFDATVRSHLFAGGIDRTVGENDQWLVGAYGLGGQIQSNFERFGGQVESDQRGAGVYGAWREDGTRVRAHLSVSGLRQDVQRRVIAGNPVSQEVASRTEATLVEAGLGIEQQVTQQVLVFGQLTHEEVRSDGFTEAGNTGFELQAAASTAKRTQVGVGVRLTDDRGTQDGWHYDASLAWAHALARPDTGFTATYTAFGAAPFRIDGMATARDAAWLAAGVSYRFGSNQMFLRGDARQDAIGTQQGWSLGWRHDF